MKKDTVVWWSTKRLAQEFSLTTSQVGKILKSIGATRWSTANAGRNTTWYFEVEK